MKNNRNSSVSRNIGKIILVFVLASGFSLHFYHENVQDNQKPRLTYDEYLGKYEKQKETDSDHPVDFIIYFFLLLISFIILFSLYEFTGIIFEWGNDRITVARKGQPHFESRVDLRRNTIIPRYLKDKVGRELEKDERIQWMDMPVPRFFTPAATGAFLFGIPWTAFALFWTAGAAWGTSHAENGAGLFSLFPLFGVPFILIGLGMLSSPVWAYRKALKTVYVITDRRAITFEGGKSITIRSYSPDRLQDIYRKEKKDGTGDVIINVKAWRDSDGHNQSEELGFLRVNNPKEIEEKLKALAQQKS